MQTEPGTTIAEADGKAGTKHKGTDGKTKPKIEVAAHTKRTLQLKQKQKLEPMKPLKPKPKLRSQLGSPKLKLKLMLKPKPKRTLRRRCTKEIRNVKLKLVSEDELKRWDGSCTCG